MEGIKGNATSTIPAFFKINKKNSDKTTGKWSPSGLARGTS